MVHVLVYEKGVYMDEFELRRMIYDYIKEICHFSQMQVFSTSSYQKNYFQLQIDEAISGLINMVFTYKIEGIEPQTESDNVVRIGVLNSSIASPEP